MYYNKIDDLVGNTPLLRVRKTEEQYGLHARLFVKLEMFNPAGSIKDRTAKFMLDEAERQGLITDGATIIEPTSGNTGIGLSALGVARGYKVILTMPDSMSVERINLLKAYGATVVLTEGSKGMQGAIEKAEQINSQTQNSIVLGQFDNPANPLAHYITTGPEIFNALNGEVDVFVAGIGTGGTLSGTGKFLKEKRPSVKVYGVEPQGSPLLTQGKSGSHKIQGIGANFIPKNFDGSVCDGIIDVSDEQAFSCAKNFAKIEGLLVGISSGAALSAGILLAKRKEFEGKNVVVLLPDTGDRYLSTELFK